MKKSLLLMSVAGIAVAGAASAAEPMTLTTSGFAHAGAGYIETAGDGDAFILRDMEIHFNAEGKSDNGITFGARVELEGFTDDSDQIDDNFVYVRGNFGEFIAGGRDNAKVLMGYGVLYTPGSHIGYYDDMYWQGLAGEIDDTGDAASLSYYTPRISGLQVGVTYIPNSAGDGAGDTNGPVVAADNVWTFGANYINTFGAVDVALSAGYVNGWDASDYYMVAEGEADRDTWSLGAQFDYQSWTLAAFFEENAIDSEDYGVAVGYTTGPWTAVLGYSNSTGWSNYENADETYDVAKDTDTVAGWVTYQVAPGVSATGGVAYSDNDDLNEDATIAMGYISLDF